MEVACLDLEGVLIPEIWIAFAEKTGIEELRRTTRDEPDYDKLMNYRLNILQQNNFGLTEIQQVISSLAPLPGAREFLDWLRQNFQVVILSDSFYEFVMPMMRQLGYPSLLCHRLQLNEKRHVTDYMLRQKNHKRQAIVAFKSLYYRTIAAGDSYNDITMLKEADAGILFNAPKAVTDKFPQFTAVEGYQSLMQEFIHNSDRDLSA